MKIFTVFALSIGVVASSIVIGNFVRNLLAEAKPPATTTTGGK